MEFLIGTAPITNNPTDELAFESNVWNNFMSNNLINSFFGGIFVLLGLIVFIIARIFGPECNVPEHTQHVLRLSAYVALHFTDWATNILAMWVFYNFGNSCPKDSHCFFYLVFTVSAHSLVIAYCIFVAVKGLDYLNCRTVKGFLEWILAILFLGVCQVVQVKLAWNNYTRLCADLTRRASRVTGSALEAGRELGEDEDSTPITTTPKFHSKTIDGLLEGSVFAFVGSYAVLKIGFPGVEDQSTWFWNSQALYCCAVFSFVSLGLAITEMDNQFSAAVRESLQKSTCKQLCHLAFRVSEAVLRILTLVVWCVFMRPEEGSISIGPFKHIGWWLVGPISIFVDYFIGLLVLCRLEGTPATSLVLPLLAVPLTIANLTQFVDEPGFFSLSRQISKLLNLYRALEFCIMVALATWISRRHTTTSRALGTGPMWKFLWERHSFVVGIWLGSLILYIALFFGYARRVQLKADLHSLVASENTQALQEMLDASRSNSNLDINRFPSWSIIWPHCAAIHVAIENKQTEYVRMLINAKANLVLRTRDSHRLTILHLAVQRKENHEMLKELFTPDPNDESITRVALLLTTNTELLNAKTDQGDTALHIAAKMKNGDTALQLLLNCRYVDRNIKDSNEHTAEQCMTRDDFRYDPSHDLFRRPPTCPRDKDLQLHSDIVATLRDSNIPLGLPIVARSIRSRESDIETAGVDLTNMGGRSRDGDTEANDTPVASADLDKQPYGREDGHQQGNSGSSPQRETNAASLPQRVEPATPAKFGIGSLFLGATGLQSVFLGTLDEDKKNTDYERGCIDFDDFRKDAKLGAGTFGSVHKVTKKDTNEVFAMKILDKRHYRMRRTPDQKVWNEKNLLQRIRHPCMVRLHYAWQNAESWVLVMDFCSGGDLNRLIVNEGPFGLPEPQCAQLSGEALLGVEYLHSHNIIHRDLKVENVVLTADKHARITDFGLAKEMETDVATTVCGSEGYAAPEIMEIRKKMFSGNYTIKVDMYSFGAMLFVLLTGGDKYDGGSDDVIAMPPQNMIRKVSSARNKFSLEAQDLLVKLLDKKPNNRPSATQAKRHPWYEAKLGRSVDSLIEDNSPAAGSQQ